MLETFLSDSSFLKELDLIQQKTQFVKIVVLDWDENPITDIQGKAINGSISLNGKSSIRRTGSLNMTPFDNYNILDVESLLSINKKIRLETGFLNTTNKYINDDIFWFNLGIFLIKNININKDTNNFTISLSLTDKMSLLNGEISGLLPTEIIHSPIQLEDGTKEFVKYKDLIRTLVHEYGNVPLHQIYINDIENSIKNTVRWVSNTPLYIKYIEGSDTQDAQYIFTINEPPQEEIADWEQFNFNENIGYQYTDFTFPIDKELISAAGDSITSVLDKLKNSLGNFEYFFDIKGNFIFQEIKNYLNEGSSLTNLAEAINDKYLINTTAGKSIYVFDDKLISSLQNSSQYIQVKNDIILWGKQKGSNNSVKDVCYHLIIDKKPIPPEAGWQYDNLNFYIDALGIQRAAANGTETIHVFDWRLKVYYDEITNASTKLYPFLSKEVVQYLPQVMNIKTGQFFSSIDEDNLYINTKELNNMTYFLDILDTNAIKDQYIARFGISDIGQRIKVINKDDVNCIFPPQFPNIVYIEAGKPTTAEERKKAIENQEFFIQMPTTVTDNISLSSLLYSGYDAIRAELHENLSYNETISINTLPIYYLEPNGRITVTDSETGISGDYLINSISLPLSYSETASISATKIIERI